MVSPRAFVAGLVLAGLCGWYGRALASGPSPTAPWYVDQYGGDRADVTAWYDGRVGVVMTTAPRPMRYIDWRLLHGEAVGTVAGDALATPCCDAPWWKTDYSGGYDGWLKERMAVAGAVAIDHIQDEQRSPDFTSTPNCFPDAFATAAVTLEDRIARHGAGSVAVKTWLAAQDSVFDACANRNARLPPPIPGAPDWLTDDRAYQTGAIALYQGRNAEAATDFRAIAMDARSPWRTSGLYLAARALVRQAIAHPTAEAFGQAHAAISALAAAPPNAFGRDRAPAMENVLAFRERPQAFLIELTRALDAAEPTQQMATSFRDYTDLGEAATPKPEALDWIDTIRAAPAPTPVSPDYRPEAGPRAVERYEVARRTAAAHATARWRAGRDPAWLVAALSLADPDDPDAAGLLADAEAIPAASPAWLSVQHHLIRLTINHVPAAATRRRLDFILARKDLSASNRNIFASQRAQVAAGLEDFAHFAVRQRLCANAANDAVMEEATTGTKIAPRCIRDWWGVEAEVQPSGRYDGAGRYGSVGLGEDARAIIDRAPLADRIALSENARLPVKLRLDIGLTSYARAVLLQDSAAIERLSRDLGPELPLMAREFAAIAPARAGPGKRFAEFMVLAKIPGLRTDLVDYVRPEGRRVEDFQEYWTDWVILARPNPASRPPSLVAYQEDGTGFEEDPWPDALTDLTCLGECGRGGAPLRLPDFIIMQTAKAAAERTRFFRSDSPYSQPEPATPPGAVHIWDEMLAYAQGHRSDPRVPEALHWLVHVGHFGGSYNHSGHRAFTLLHARYPSSYWAKQTPYYND